MSQKLWAVVDSGAMNGDSAFYCPASRVRYYGGMTLEDVREAYRQFDDGYWADDADDIKIAWILTDKMVKQLENSAPECGNDTAVYTVNKVMKNMAATMAIKTLSEGD